MAVTRGDDVGGIDQSAGAREPRARVFELGVHLVGHVEQQLSDVRMPTVVGHASCDRLRRSRRHDEDQAPQQEQKETASQEDLHVGARDLLSRPLATLLPDVKRCDNGEVGILVVWPVSAQSVSSTSKPISQCTPNRSITCPSEAPHARFWRSSTTRPPSDKRANQAIRPPRLGPEVGRRNRPL